MDKARLARATLNEKALDNIFSEYEHEQKKTPANDASWDRWDFPDELPAKTSWHLAHEEGQGQQGQGKRWHDEEVATADHEEDATADHEEGQGQQGQGSKGSKDLEEVATADHDEDVDLSDMRTAPKTNGRPSHLSKQEVARLRYEQAMAQAADVPWSERGPRRTQSHTQAPHWRGQRLRPGLNGGKSRYANRGGRYKEHYAHKARLGLVGGALGTKGHSYYKGKVEGKGSKAKAGSAGEGKGNRAASSGKGKEETSSEGSSRLDASDLFRLCGQGSRLDASGDRWDFPDVL